MRWRGGYYYSVALAFLPAGVAGCSEELGAERFTTTTVTGRLLDGGRPVVKGWVEFLPAGGTVGKPRSAPIQADGRFAADHVAVGWNRIGVVGAPLNPQYSGMFHPFASPIRRKIPAQPSRIDLDLLTEAIESRRPKSKGP